MSHRHQHKQKPGSRFICLKCLKFNGVGEGIQRKVIRPKFHIKDIFCVGCDCITKNVEVRYDDFYEEVSPQLEELNKRYYMEELV